MMGFAKKQPRRNQMKSTLQKKTEEWMALERQTLEQRKKAELFYEQELIGRVTKEYIANNQSKVSGKIKYLIMSVGTSYEPLVLNISLLKPERIHFLYTEQSENILDKVAEICKLKMSQIEKSKVNETEPTDIYREIKKCYLEWGRPERLYIDFTGGTKAMSTAAAMASAVVDVQMIYVGTNKYMQDFRKPFPGSERLFYISNPMDVFGDLEIEKAYTLFGGFNYSGVCEKLSVLKEEVPDPVVRQELNFVYLLAQTYENWDALEFQDAYQTIMRLNREITRDKKNNRQFVLADFADKLAGQERTLEALNDVYTLAREKKNMEILKEIRYCLPLMFTMYQNADVREEQEKYDMATLLLYRLLEMIEQRRLATYNLFVSRMDYRAIRNVGNDDIETTLTALKNRVCALKEQVFGRCSSTYLPDQVSLLDGFILLAALGDDIMLGGQDPVKKLKRIRAMVSLRNNSIFAHGLAPVSKDDFIKFKAFVKDLFREFCGIENVDFGKECAGIKWLSPLESCYYQKR